MQLIDAITLGSGAEAKRIEFCVGDLTDLRPTEAVEILVVSAFPNDYTPLKSTLIGSLHKRGVSLQEIAASKVHDLRNTCSCWLSKPIDADDTGIQFNQILCFEPLVRGKPAEVVGDIFRSLLSLIPPDSAVSVAMPLVACGNMKVKPSIMLQALLGAAIQWMSMGVPIKTLKVAIRNAEGAEELKEIFTSFKAANTPVPEPEACAPKYDVFLSYAHNDWDSVAVFVEELQRCRPGVRIFLDRQELSPGMAWQQEIYEALDACHNVVAFLSPSYLTSKICQEEFNIARYRHREQPILFPIYLHSASLPPSIAALIQYVDCREGDPQALRTACARFLQAAIPSI